MTQKDTNLTADFKARAESYRDGQTIFLIDGSGSMPAAYGGQNAINTAVTYAKQVKEELNPAASAFFFGPQGAIGGIPIDLDSGEDPMRRFPASDGNLMPAFDAIAAGYADGRINKKLHLVIVSDGGISELFDRSKTEETRAKLVAFLRKNPDVMLDIIVPGGQFAEFGVFVKSLLPADDPQAPRLYEAVNAEELPCVMAKALNTRTGAQAVFDNAVQEAREGVQQSVKVRTPLKLKKNVVE